MPNQQGSHALADALDSSEGSGNRSATSRLVAARVILQQQRVIAESVQHLSQALDSLLGPGSQRVADASPSGADPLDGLANPRRLAVCCLGSFQLLLNGTPVQNWRSSKARSLFLYLVSHRGRLATRENIVDALWPDNENAPATDALKVVVHRLRRTLSATDARMEVLAADDGYGLAAPDLWVDVEEFERLCSLARRQERNELASAAIETFTTAADLYRGDFLEEVAEDWVCLRRERLKDQYLLALARLTDAAFAAGDFQGCIERCQQILAHDPCREKAYRFLMCSYAHLGQRGRVRRWYEVCRQTLRAELDVAPEPDTARTYAQAIAGELPSRITRSGADTNR